MSFCAGAQATTNVSCPLLVTMGALISLIPFMSQNMALAPQQSAPWMLSSWLKGSDLQPLGYITTRLISPCGVVSDSCRVSSIIIAMRGRRYWENYLKLFFF